MIRCVEFVEQITELDEGTARTVTWMWFRQLRAVRAAMRHL